MTPTTAAKQTHIGIDEDKELGFGTMLIAESEDGGYEPVATVSTIREARELAAENVRIRRNELESNEEPFCPAQYRVWGRVHRGNYRVICTIDA